MKKELKSGILSADKSADGRPTVGGVYVIAVLRLSSITFIIDINSFDQYIRSYREKLVPKT